MGKEFLCPECSGEVPGMCEMVETVFCEGDPWSAVLQRIHCAQCGSIIPAHLAERWKGISLQDAQREWVSIYRDCQPKEKE